VKTPEIFQVKEKLRFPGVPVYLNGRNYFIPSLSTRQYRENQEALEGIVAKNDDESDLAYGTRILALVIPLIGLAIRRNHPEVTDENLWDWLDTSTWGEVWRATQAASGMTKVTEGEELPAAPVPTGTGYTDASPQV
jgi:hypothetical protein